MNGPVCQLLMADDRFEDVKRAAENEAYQAALFVLFNLCVNRCSEGNMKTGLVLEGGGCADSIPVRAFQKMGYDRNVVVLTQPEDYRKKPEFARLARIAYRKYPAFAKTLSERHLTYNRTAGEIREMEKSGEVFVIRPERALEIGRMEKDPVNVERIYQIGRKDAGKREKALREWMDV